MRFPEYRLRRMRASPLLRDMVRETRVSQKDLVMPYFVVEGKNIRKEIPSLPGQFHLSIDELIKEADEIEALGIPAIILFGIPDKKDVLGTSAYKDDGIIQKACMKLKENTKNIVIITDVCLCEYTKNGHCGIVKGERIMNDETLPILAKIAISHVKAGSDIVAPSDMMDGRIGFIRKALDDCGYKDIPILSYSAKYASSLYTPFRYAADCAPAFGDRTTYQMDISNSNEALREVAHDIQEGADIVMIKPALPYLDVIYRVKEEFKWPVCAFNVSGEYAMIKSAALMNFIDEKRTVNEILTSIKRAGSDIIITYFAKEYAKGLSD